MQENYVDRIYNENNNENEKGLLYNDNEVSNYEEQACCNNILFSTFGNNNIFSYINDICFKDIPIDDEEINNNLNHEMKTPLGSNKKKLKLTPDDIIINAEENNNNININNQNQNLLNNSLASNPSNDSAAEPIRPLRRNNTNIVNKEKLGNSGGISIFSSLANIFKDLFGDKKENIDDDLSDNQSVNSRISFKKRPILRRLLTNDEENKNKINKDKNKDKNSYNNSNKSSHKKEKRQKIFEEILTLKIEENNEEDIINLVSAIPAFIVKEKNKNNNNTNCPICLGKFKLGEKESSLPCLHFFHSNCIENWLKRNKSCPVCKLKISWESLKGEF